MEWWQIKLNWTGWLASEVFAHLLFISTTVTQGSSCFFFAFLSSPPQGVQPICRLSDRCGGPGMGKGCQKLNYAKQGRDLLLAASHLSSGDKTVHIWGELLKCWNYASRKMNMRLMWKADGVENFWPADAESKEPSLLTGLLVNTDRWLWSEADFRWKDTTWS